MKNLEKIELTDKNIIKYSKACVKWPLINRQNEQLNEGQMVASIAKKLLSEHSAIFLTCIKR